MLHFPFFRPMLCLATDAGSASGVYNAADGTAQQTCQAEAVQDTQTAETQADAKAAPAAQKQLAEENQTESDTKRAQERFVTQTRAA